MFGFVFWPFHRHQWAKWGPRRYYPDDIPSVLAGNFLGVYRECSDCHKRQRAKGVR